MKVCARRFNLFLTPVLALALFCGCQTDKQSKVVAMLRVHIEVSPDQIGTSQTISFPRTDPVVVTFSKEPVLTEENIIAAKMIESPGGLGYAVAVQFDETGELMLEQYTAANPGKHFVIYGQWGDKVKDGRWLATPLITHHIANGVLSFNGDFSSTNELGKLVLGLNNVAKKTHKELQK